jgi:RNA recognition motif-containing protein
VGGVSFNVDGNKLWDAFAKCGEVLEAKVVMDKVNPNHSRGFGFVTFKTAESSARAVAEMNDTELDGRTITVNASTKREPTNTQNQNGGNQLFDARARTECWFCLASEKVETWLISSIGDEVVIYIRRWR